MEPGAQGQLHTGKLRQGLLGGRELPPYKSALHSAKYPTGCKDSLYRCRISGGETGISYTCVSFLGLLSLMITNFVAGNSTGLFPHSSGGQSSKTRFPGPQCRGGQCWSFPLFTSSRAGGCQAPCRISVCSSHCPPPPHTLMSISLSHKDTCDSTEGHQIIQDNVSISRSFI